MCRKEMEILRRVEIKGRERCSGRGRGRHINKNSHPDTESTFLLMVRKVFSQQLVL